VTVTADGLKFYMDDVINHIISLKLHIYNKNHFYNALYDLLYDSIHDKTYIPYFFIGYKSEKSKESGELKRTEKFAHLYNTDKNTDERIFLPYIDDDIPTEDAIGKIYEYIQKQPSAGMLLTYTFFAVTYYFFKEYCKTNRTLRMDLNKDIFSFNYYGDDLRYVYQDVNLFSNMFKATTSKTITGSENIILNSAGYDIENHLFFKDIPIVVTAKKASLSASNSLLKEIICFRAKNNLPFSPVIISEKELSFAETISVRCDNNVILSRDKYKELKKYINTLIFRMIEYIDSDHSYMIDITETHLRNQTSEKYLRRTNYYDATAYMLMSYSLNMASDVLSQLDNKYTHHDLINRLRNILDIHMFDPSLADPDYADHESQLPDDIVRIIRFVKDTYEQHKDDTPQKTAWSEPFDDASTGKFNPSASDRRWIYINNKSVDEFIEKNISTDKTESKKLKALLHTHNLLRKNGSRYTFKKNDHGQTLCYCFYIEFE
ncbi:MAG: hypothetical protein J1F64_06975, partial [Oscillospiraceae bacterium]|nr:hypothetical protein [Oscillospiraceae bacterium]